MSTATPNNVSTLGRHNGKVGNVVATQAVVNVASIPTAQLVRPNSGIVLAKNVVFKTMNSTVPRPSVTNVSNQIEIRNEDIQSSLQIRTEDNKKIIISGAKSMKDIPANFLHQILNNVKNVKSNETILVVNTPKEASVPSKKIKSYESIVQDVLQSDETDMNVPEDEKASDKNSTPSDSLKNDTVVDQKDAEKESETNKISLKSIDHADKNIVNESDHEYIQNKTITDSKKACNKNEIITSRLGSSQNDGTKTSIPSKVINVEANRKIDQDKKEYPKVEMSVKPTLAVAPRQSPKRTMKQKKFLYRLKSKNGKVLSYVSDTHITLKKPIIRLDKMTQADAERLSKQFAEERRNGLKRSRRFVDSRADSNRKVKSSKKYNSKEKTDQNESQDSASQSTYGVQTRKKNLKFLPDGRVLRDKKSKVYESSSSLSSLDNDELDKPVVTSDEDYHEDVDIPMLSSDDEKDIRDFIFKSTNTKKIISPKKVSPEKSNLLNNKVDIKSTSKTYCKKPNDSKISTAAVVQPKLSASPAVVQPKLSASPAVVQPKLSASPAVVQPKLSASPAVVQPKTLISPAVIQSKTIINARPIQHRVSVDAPTIFATLLKVPIKPHQLNIRRFKPKVQSTPDKTNTSFMFKKVFSPDLKQLIPLLKTSPNVSSSTTQNINKPATLPQSTIWSHNNISQKFDYNDPPPLAPLSNSGFQASRNDKMTFKTPASRNRLPYQPSPDITAKFEGYTNTKVVKTKEGPKKAIINELSKLDEPRTIYDMMEEIFDSMPHWNIHVIPENKSFCLAQISLGRTGIPVLKKSIEINSEFMAKVYVHQLHCKRYDGIYDTESKIRKLIQDVDAVVV